MAHPWVISIDSLSGPAAPLLASLAEAVFPTANADVAPTVHRDLALCRRILDGDRDAFATIVADHQEALAQQLWRFSRNPAICAELLQTVFVEAWTSLHNYQGRAPLRHWLRRIAVRVGYRFWQERTRRRWESAELPHDVASSSAAEERRDEIQAAADRTARVLEKLAPRDRLVITLLHLEERTVAEIAEMTGWSVTMVKVQAWRARQKMKRLLGEEAR